MLWNVLRLEARKLLWPRLLWAGLLVLAALIAVDYGFLFAFRANVGAFAPYVVWPGVLVYALGLAAGYQPYTSYGTCLLIILVGLGIAREYSWRTLHQWLARGASRPHVLVSKLLLGGTQAVLVVLVCLVTVSSLGAILTAATGGSVGLTSADLAHLIAAVGRTAYSMLPYAALTVLLGVLTRSAWGAIGGGLAFLAVVESTLLGVLPLLGPGFARAAQYLPASLAAALDGQNAVLGHVPVVHGPLQADPRVAAAAIAGYTLVLAGAALAAFRRQDLT